MSDTPKIGNGLVQLIRIDGSIRQMWVKHTEMYLRNAYGMANSLDPDQTAQSGVTGSTQIAQTCLHEY